jgi:hypothetical protein
MRHTAFRDESNPVVKGRAEPYLHGADGFSRPMATEQVFGNGGLLTTVDDLLTWNRHFDRSGAIDAALLDALQTRTQLSNGRTHEYAFGLYVDTYQGIREVDHGGGGLGYAGHLGRYPDQQVSVAVICNLEQSNTTAMAKSVARLFLTGLQASSPPPATHSLTVDEAARLTGLYRSLQPVGTLAIEFVDNRLRVAGVANLAAQSESLFLGDDGFRYEFGDRGRLRAIDEFGQVTAYDRYTSVTPSMGELREFVGRYTSDEVNSTLELVVDDRGLTVRRPPDWNLPLTPVWQDAFRGDLGWVTFERDAQRRVVRLNVSQDRMWRLPFERR